MIRHRVVGTEDFLRYEDAEAFPEGQNQFFDKREDDNHEKFRQI
jgi:hypothetical protein